MKKLLQTTLIIVFLSGSLFSQNYTSNSLLENYLKSDGALEDFCTVTHPANTCVSGKYRMEGNYVIVEIVSEFGIKFYTDLKLRRGIGDLYFTEITIINDTTLVPAFTAFKTISALIYKLMKEIDPETMQKISDAIKSNFGSNPENWSGNTWALYAINLSCAVYLATH